MHTCILKVVYIHNELLHVSANRVAIFRDLNRTFRDIQNYKNEIIKYQNQSIDVKNNYWKILCKIKTN
jgi:hypothetical protein